MACIFSCCTSSNERERRGLLDENDEDELRRQVVEREKKIVLRGKLRRLQRKNVYARPIDLDTSFVFPNYPKSEETAKFLKCCLKDPEKFIASCLNDEQRTDMVNAMQLQEFKKGTVIIRQGDEGDFVYIVEYGVVESFIDSELVGSCTRGGGFGELALLYDCPRAATCVAKSACRLWKMDQQTFKILLARTTRVIDTANIEVLKKVPLLSTFDVHALTKLVDALTTVKFQKGERIFSKGDPGELFYIIRDGIVKLDEIVIGSSRYRDHLFGPGDFFGDVALITGKPRPMNATAETDCTMFCVSLEDFHELFGKHGDIASKEVKKRNLLSVPIFHGASINSFEVDQLVDLTSEQCVKKGWKIEERGKPTPDNLYMVYYGKLLVVNEDGTLNTIGFGGYYGADYILSGEGKISSRTVTVEENTCFAVLSKSDILSVIGDVSRLRESLEAASPESHSSIKLRDLKKQRILGVGGFGKVWLVTEKKTKTPYALKVLDKRQLIRSNQAKAVIREKNIMASIEHPFTISLVSSFQDENDLYMLLDLVQGGELFTRLHGNGNSLVPREDAIFYGACVIDVLSHLHEHSIAYRDVKPENVLIGSDGYCVVIDFGFAKVVLEKTYTLCGTPEYLAPEILMSKGHNEAADYWSFGILVHEMVVGRTPFAQYLGRQMDLFKHIVLIKYPPPLIEFEARDLIEKLLVRPIHRLGNLAQGCLDIKHHPWFQGLDFKKLRKKEIKPPWIPPISNPLDASHFDDFKQEEAETTTFTEDLPQEDQGLFKNF